MNTIPRYYLRKDSRCIGKTTNSLDAVYRHTLRIIDSHTDECIDDRWVIVSNDCNKGQDDLYDAEFYMQRQLDIANQDYENYINDIVTYCEVANTEIRR